MPTHKSGKLKQENKKHKLHGKTKSSSNNPVNGRVENKRPQPKSRTNFVNSKQDRINRQRQLMQEKRWANFRLKRQSISSVSRIVAVLPLHENVSIEGFKAALSNTTSGDWTLVESETTPTMATYRCKTQKCNFQFLFDPSFESLMDPMWSMELLGVSDSVVLLTDYDIDNISPLVGDVGEKNLQLISAFGCSNPVVVSINRGAGARMNLKNVPKKWKYDVDHFVQQTEVVGVTRYLDISEHNLSTVLSDNSKKSLRWRNQRSYMMTSHVTIEPQAAEETADQGEGGSTGPKYRVTLEGCLRGVPMYAHSLVHVCGVGAGRITRIKQQAPLATPTTAGGEEMFSLEDQIVTIDPTKQDDMVIEATPDELMGEQTWPTEHEMNAYGEHDEEDAEDEDADGGMDDEEGDRAGDDHDDEDSKVENIDDFLAGIKQLDSSAQKQTNSELQGGKKGKGVRFDAMEDGDEEPTEEEDWDHNLHSEKVLLTRGQRRQQREEEGVPEDVVDDYVDTPSDTSARARFARYRALQSFRSSHWNPKENLPEQYGRIFNFQDMKGMQRRLHHQLNALRRLQVDPLIAATQQAKKQAHSSSRSRANSSAMEGGGMDADDDDHDDAMSMGGATTATSASAMALTLENAEDYIRSDQVITVELSDVPAAVVATYRRQGYLVWYALHGYEYKCSVLHYQIRRVNPVVNRQTNMIADEAVVKSKDLLLFHTGFRAFWARPVFSEANLNSEKAKFLRYLPRTVTTVGEGGPGTDASALLDAATIERNAASNFVSATVIGPVNMAITNAPVLVFKYDTEKQTWQLIANGAMSSVDPDRVVLKKIILYGNPIRVRKRTAVVRHMFYDPQDVEWFKPAELTTLLGLRGHIKESVGTHGLFKAIFSAAISQNDQVNLVLYKRVYPKLPAIEELPYGETLATTDASHEEARNSLDKGWPLLFM